jgi:hypothetical protein
VHPPWLLGVTRRSRVGWRSRRWSAQCLQRGESAASVTAARNAQGLDTHNAPPPASKSIFNMLRGPKVVRMMSATAWRAQLSAGQHPRQLCARARFPKPGHTTRLGCSDVTKLSLLAGVTLRVLVCVRKRAESRVRCTPRKKQAGWGTYSAPGWAAACPASSCVCVSRCTAGPRVCRRGGQGMNPHAHVATSASQSSWPPAERRFVLE